MAITQQTWEWSNLTASGTGNSVGRQVKGIPVGIAANTPIDIFTGDVGNIITIPPATKATQFIVMDDFAITPTRNSYVQVRVNTTNYFQNPDVTTQIGIPAIAVPYPCGSAPSTSNTGTEILRNSFEMNPALYVLPGQTWTMTYQSRDGVPAGSGDGEGGAVGVIVYYTLYDGPDALIANKLLEMGLPVNEDNVDWYKLQVMSKNLTSLTQTGGVR
tara:strand:- start:1490 stop:2137 length:648 start_codon:yes stop_codon:yes gene_type:complete